MACYNPIRAYRGPINPDTGRNTLLWNKPKPENGVEAKEWLIPCGKCIGCRKMQADNWAIRCVHESKMHKENCFVTLTYAPEHVPENKSLDRNAFLSFLKNVKNQNPGKRIRYLYCGEYTKKGIPHYHALLFGHSFPDQKLLTKRKSHSVSYNIYTSEQCTNAWQNKGFITIGEINIHTASYVGKYCFKKSVRAKYLNGKLQPYANMSRRPGIGSTWYEKFKGDVYPSDECRTIDGGCLRPPRYYDEKLRKEDPETYKKIKYKREKAGKSLTPLKVGSKTILVSDNDSVRLSVKEFCAMAKRPKNQNRQMEAEN